MKLLFLLLTLFTSFNFSNHKEAESSNVLINDINKPLSQNEILRIVDFKIVVGENIVDLELKLVLDEYKDNMTNLGIYNQKYEVTYEGGKYVCNLTIYNVDLKQKSTTKRFEVYTKKNYFLSEALILEMISVHFDFEIFSYVIKNNNYFNNSDVGVYNQNIIITTKNNQVIEIELTINVEKTINYFLIIGITIIVLTSLIIVLINRKRYKNDKKG